MKGTVLRRHGRWLTWGATAAEVEATLPGDELLAGPDIVSTRAVTVDAPPEAVWPWLVQMGSGRGGAYTYDWIENLLGLDMHSADEILPQFQHLAVGDGLPLGKNGPAMRVEVLDPQRALVFRSADGTWVWGFHLQPKPTGTRLISRNRIALAHRPGPGRTAYRLVMEPGSLIMERRMLLGIKQRAEGTP
ncbi:MULTISPECIES: SRPBCC family protein [unclassified Micromonospora]|uniref:SRPBCC family protein n=1 Tax=unclassified Micromonospora TaxID=2617518 RepID=UPI001C24F0D2|nr:MULTISPECIES: SRPBCC family protein [unclassified Micromonospora]MBU8860277.1 SRPBCC family protein [Micromonospora sp. WMMB482]MDM4779810.1 SRPBCC family protein [Micromonospora sp. b486]